MTRKSNNRQGKHKTGLDKTKIRHTTKTQKQQTRKTPKPADKYQLLANQAGGSSLPQLIRLGSSNGINEQEAAKRAEEEAAIMSWANAIQKAQKIETEIVKLENQYGINQNTSTEDKITNYKEILKKEFKLTDNRIDNIARFGGRVSDYRKAVKRNIIFQNEIPVNNP